MSRCLVFSTELRIKQVLQSGRFGLTLIAETNQWFKDFSPYVASLNDAGHVAFQAALCGGGTGVFIGDGHEIITLAKTEPGCAPGIYSHPDINNAREVVFYKSLKPGQEEVALVTQGKEYVVEPNRESFRGIGPLGPTLNDAGMVAFRGGHASGSAGIFVGSIRECIEVAHSGERFAGFQGLPVINNAGVVVFRADLAAGGQGIYSVKDGSVATIVETGRAFRGLGLFPALNDGGTVAFVGVEENGRSGVFTASQGDVYCLVDRDAPFENFRGVLIHRKGLAAFYAVPAGGQLGIYTGPDPVADRVISIGDPLIGSTVSEFALNPVSVNETGQLAIRLRLENNHQLIVRVDPQ